MAVRRDRQACSDEELAAEYAAGAHDAFDALYGRYARRLLYFIERMLQGDRERARDLLQELFLKLAERPERFDPSRKFSTWVFSIANNMCKNEYRRRRYAVEFDAEDLPSGTPLPDFDAMQFHQALGAAIECLSPAHQAVFLLRHYEGFTLRDIAEALDIPEGTVKSRLHHTMRHLSEKLAIFKDRL